MYRKMKQNRTAGKNGWHSLVLNGPVAIRKVKLPICDGHHAGQDKCDRPGEETEHDQDAAKELKHAADACLRH